MAPSRTRQASPVVDEKCRIADLQSRGVSLRLGLVLLVATAQIGCGKSPEMSRRTSVTLASASPVEERACISGRATLTGGIPAGLGAVIDVGNNPYCGAHAKVIESTWSVSPDGGLADVVIAVRGSGRASNVPADPVLIDQFNCAYQPHVTVLQPGQAILVRNSDDTFHNVRLVRHDPTLRTTGENLRNIGQPVKGSSNIETFDEPGVYRLECDVHRWMKSWVYVHTGIHVAASAASGTFAINRALPDGTYVVEAWHPNFPGTKTATVQLVAGKATANFQFDLAEAIVR